MRWCDTLLTVCRRAGVDARRLTVRCARATLIGVAPAAQLLKYVQFRRYPSLELALVFVFAYAPYVTAEGVGLSGTRAGDPQRANAYGRHDR